MKNLENIYLNMSFDGPLGVFGPVIQGEGKFQGTKSVFIRTSGCGLRCAWKNATDDTITICDSEYTSFTPERNKVSVLDIIEKVKELKTYHVVITGGEPFLQKNIVYLIDALVDNNFYVTVETNGTEYHANKAQFISLSPKLSTSSAHPKYGEKHELNRLRPEVLAQFYRNHKCQMKFVVNQEDDIKEIKSIRNLVRESYMSNYPDDRLRMLVYRREVYRKIHNSIWLMPQGITTEQLNDRAQMVAKLCTDYGFSMSDRLHIRIFGNQRST